MTELTSASLDLFRRLAMDAPHWNNQPLLDITKEQRGNLTDLKRNGLVRTERSDGCDWVIFTPAGREFAAAQGVPINPEND